MSDQILLKKEKKIVNYLLTIKLIEVHLESIKFKSI